MITCVNENCNKNPFDNPNWVPWGCDFDACCNQHCYGEALKQMDNLWGVIARDDHLYAQHMGVPVDTVRLYSQKEDEK